MTMQDRRFRQIRLAPGCHWQVLVAVPGGLGDLSPRPGPPNCPRPMKTLGDQSSVYRHGALRETRRAGPGECCASPGTRWSSWPRDTSIAHAARDAARVPARDLQAVHQGCSIPLIQISASRSPRSPGLPLGLVLFGQAPSPPRIFTIALCSMWPTVLNTAMGVRAIPQDYMNVARVLQLSKLGHC
jgi:hypothetical protein